MSIITSNSPGTITLTSSNDNVVDITGTTADVQGLGTSIITITQAETANFNSATTTFSIAVAKPDPNVIDTDGDGAADANDLWPNDSSAYSASQFRFAIDIYGISGQYVNKSNGEVDYFKGGAAGARANIEINKIPSGIKLTDLKWKARSIDLDNDTLNPDWITFLPSEGQPNEVDRDDNPISGDPLYVDVSDYNGSNRRNGRVILDLYYKNVFVSTISQKIKQEGTGTTDGALVAAQPPEPAPLPQPIAVASANTSLVPSINISAPISEAALEKERQSALSSDLGFYYLGIGYDSDTTRLLGNLQTSGLITDPGLTDEFNFYLNGFYIGRTINQQDHARVMAVSTVNAADRWAAFIDDGFGSPNSKTYQSAFLISYFKPGNNTLRMFNIKNNNFSKGNKVNIKLVLYKTITAPQVIPGTGGFTARFLDDPIDIWIKPISGSAGSSFAFDFNLSNDLLNLAIAQS